MGVVGSIERENTQVGEISIERWEWFPIGRLELRFGIPALQIFGKRVAAKGSAPTPEMHRACIEGAKQLAQRLMRQDRGLPTLDGIWPI